MRFIREYSTEILVLALVVATVAGLLFLMAVAPAEESAYRCQGGWSFGVGPKGQFTSVYDFCKYIVPKEGR